MAKAGQKFTKDFFISYTRADREWAKWIDKVLKSDGHKTVIQAWDFGPGCNFVAEMHKALLNCRRLLLVYSPQYFESLFTQAEWFSAFAGDPVGSKRTLFPVRVAPCEPAGLLAPIVYCDLVHLSEEQARKQLLRDARPLPPEVTTVVFPGVALPKARSRCDCVSELRDILNTTLVTFNAQCGVRDNLHATMVKRLKIREVLQFEAFFHKYFKLMNDGELRDHAIIRGYTKSVLHEYNTRALKLCEELDKIREPHARFDIHDEINSLSALKNHLKVWLARYKIVMKFPSTCLVYAGVEDDMEFPHHIDAEIQSYLETNCGAPRTGRRKRPARELEGED